MDPTNVLSRFLPCISSLRSPHVAVSTHSSSVLGVLHSNILSSDTSAPPSTPSPFLPQGWLVAGS